jgi:chromate reductase
LPWAAPGSAFDTDGKLLDEAHLKNVQAVIDQVLFASARLST